MFARTLDFPISQFRNKGVTEVLRATSIQLYDRPDDSFVAIRPVEQRVSNSLRCFRRNDFSAITRASF